MKTLLASALLLTALNPFITHAQSRLEITAGSVDKGTLVSATVGSDSMLANG
jgi:hypothetical protein